MRKMTLFLAATFLLAGFTNVAYSDLQVPEFGNAPTILLSQDFPKKLAIGTVWTVEFNVQNNSFEEPDVDLKMSAGSCVEIDKNDKSSRKFRWDTKGLSPGKYKGTITAENEFGINTLEFEIELYIRNPKPGTN